MINAFKQLPLSSFRKGRASDVQIQLYRGGDLVYVLASRALRLNRFDFDFRQGYRDAAYNFQYRLSIPVHLQILGRQLNPSEKPPLGLRIILSLYRLSSNFHSRLEALSKSGQLP